MSKPTRTLGTRPLALWCFVCLSLTLLFGYLVTMSIIHEDLFQALCFMCLIIIFFAASILAMVRLNARLKYCRPKSARDVCIGAYAIAGACAYATIRFAERGDRLNLACTAAVCLGFLVIGIHLKSIYDERKRLEEG